MFVDCKQVFDSTHKLKLLVVKEGFGVQKSLLNNKVITGGRMSKIFN